MISFLRSTRPQAVLAYSSDALWKSLSFWRTQWQLLAVLIAGLIIGILLMPLTSPRNDNLLSCLVILIYPLAIWGAYRATKILAEIELEHSIVAAVERQGSEKLAEIRGNPTRRIDLNHLEETIIPRCGGTTTPAMVQMFQHICQDARDHSFESRVTVMHPHREKALAGILELQNIQKLALRLGILGTFVGLLMAIISLAESVQDTPAASTAADLFQRLHQDQEHFAFIASRLFDALHVSFGTSVAGLEVSVLLGVVMMMMHRRIESYFRDMEDAAGTMLSLARNAINQDSFFTEFSQIRNAMGQLEERIYQQTRSISREFHYVAEHLKKQTADFEVGLGRLQKVRKEWTQFMEDMQGTQLRLVEDVDKSNNKTVERIDGYQNAVSHSFQSFFKSLEASQRQFLDDAQQVLDLLSVGKLGASLSASIKDAGSGISLTIQPQLERVSDELNELAGTNQGLLEANDRLQQRLSETQGGLTELRQSKIEMDRFLQQTNENYSNFTRHIETLVSSLAQKNLGEAIRQDLAKTGQSFSTATSNHLQSITTETRKLRENLAKLTDDTSALVKYLPRSPIYGFVMWVGVLAILAGGGWAFWSLFTNLLR